MNKLIAIAAIVVSALSSVACAADTTNPGEASQPVTTNGSALAETSVARAGEARPLSQSERMVRSDVEAQIRGIYVDRSKALGEIVGGTKTLSFEGKADRERNEQQEFRGRQVLTRPDFDVDPTVRRSELDGLVEDDKRNDLFGPSPK